MGLLEKIQAKLEISRLEKRYTRSRAKRTTWISDAHYVDGEYVYWSHDISPVSSQRSMDSKWSSIRAKPLKKRESFLA